MKARTEIDFNTMQDFQSLFEKWAAEHGYKFKGMENDMQVFQRGAGFWTAPMRVAFRQNGVHIHLEAYIFAPLISRLMAVFLLPKETQIESGGFVASVPRTMARKDLNALLEIFGQPPLK